MRKTLSSSGMLGRQGNDRVDVRRLLSAESTKLHLETLTDSTLRAHPD
jgi:hypothetical protein